MEEHESGIGMAELQDSLKEVRGKKAIAKMNHKLKAKNRVHARQHNLTEMIDDLESKGIAVNKESLRSRSKSRRTIAEIEAGQDRYAKDALDESDDGMVIDDAQMAKKESKDRGRLKKRTRTVDSDIDMDDEMDKAAGKIGRSMTPAQRHISAQKKHRSLTQERREGTVPKRLPSKPVPESHVRLAQKIEKKVFRTNLFKDSTDRMTTAAKPKHLYTGKVDSAGKRDRR